MKNRVNWLQRLLAWLDPRLWLLVVILVIIYLVVPKAYWDIEMLVNTSKTEKTRDSA